MQTQSTSSHLSHAHRHSDRQADAPPAPSPRTPGNAQWTCPMHPELVRDAPGDCPICGMALVPVAGTDGDEGNSAELRDLGRRLWVGVALCIPLVIIAMAPMLGIHGLFGLEPHTRGWVEFFLGTPVVL